MKVSGAELGKAIRKMVREELQKMLPRMISEHLSERYLQKIVSEGAPKQRERHLKLSERLESEQDDDGEENLDNHVPEVPENRHQGIYANKSPRVNENVSKLLSRDNPMSFAFEGVQPIPAAGDVATPDIPLDKFEKAFDLDFEKMARLAGASSERTAQSMTPQQKMRELEARRQALEVPVR